MGHADDGKCPYRSGFRELAQEATGRKDARSRCLRHQGFLNAYRSANALEETGLHGRTQTRGGVGPESLILPH